jgi:signal transduction histidine kinase
LDVRKAITRKDAENWQIQESAKVKEMVLANMSHELLTPLNAIVGYAQLLEDTSSLPVSEQREYVEHILERSHFLLRIITNILNLTDIKLEGMEFFYEQSLVYKEIAEVIASLRKTPDLKKIKLSIDLDPPNLKVKMDRYWFKQIINCYVSNAIEIAPPEGAVSIRVRHEAKGLLYIEIKDSEATIDVHDLDALFQQDEQAYTTVLSKYPGLGFNLMLIKQIVEAQGGKMGVKLAKKGCIFYARLRCE